MKKKAFFVIILIAIGIITYNYIYQDHRDIDTEKPEYKTTTQTIIGEFKLDPLVSEKKYLNKTIEVSGIITEANKKDLTLNNTIFCQFIEYQPVDINSRITIKGRCIGYDDLLEQVKLDQCSIIK